MTPEEREIGRCIFREAYDGYVIARPDDFRIVDVNPAVLRLSQFRRKQLLDLTVPDLIEAEITSHLSKVLSACQTTSHLLIQDGFTLKTATGSKIAVHLTVSRIHTEPQPLALIIIRDQTDRNRVAQALEESESRLAEAQRIAQVGSWELDLIHGQASWSDEGYRRLGLEPRVLPANQETFLSCVHPDDRDAVFAATRRAIESRGELNEEFRVLWPNGSERWLNSRGRATYDATGRPTRFIGITLDITERKRAEAEHRRLENQIQHSQKLESLGMMAGGIAHDFNNLLTAILGYADLALMELPVGSSAHDAIQHVVKGAHRAAELANQMLAYAGKGRSVMVPVDLPEVIHDLIDLLKVSISKKAILHCHLNEELAPIEADAAQLRQVLMNLIINASDALGEREGVITVRAEYGLWLPDGPDGCYRSRELLPGTYVVIEVIDTGCGMSPETLKRIFDPFFTTKFTGRGLGLAATLGIIHNHGGAIQVMSTLGRGTTFQVYLPTARQSLAPVANNAESVNWQGQGTILLIDDEESVCGVAQQMLQSLGFAVMTARDGKEGIEAYRTSADLIQAVVLDLNMPGMDGIDTYQHLRQIRPDLRIIFCSGYGETDIAHRLGTDAPHVFVAKPYRLHDLRQALLRVFSQPAITVPTR